MDEFTSIAVWLTIGILTLNFVIMWADANASPGSPMMLENLGPTTLSSVNSDRNALEQCVSDVNGGNYVAPSTPYNSKGTAATVQCGSNFMFNDLKVVFTGMQLLLQGVFADVPGGDLFAGILTAFISITEAIAMFVVGLRIAIAARGLFAV